MIFLDSNLPMYLVGSSHPHKTDAQRLLERLISDRDRLVTDAEVLQEILHRYVAIRRADFIQPASDALLGITSSQLTSPLPSAPSRLCSAIRASPSATPFSLPLCSSRKSRASSPSTPALMAFQESNAFADEAGSRHPCAEA
jgi:predicted nucleic acid-binding protein